MISTSPVGHGNPLGHSSVVITLEGDALHELQAVAKRRGIDLSSVVEESFVLQQWLDEHLEIGSHLEIVTKDGKRARWDLKKSGA